MERESKVQTQTRRTPKTRSVHLQIRNNMKSEFEVGMVESLKRFLTHSSLMLTLIFFVGHVVIATTVVSLMTGASIWEAGAVALVEPAVNSVWFYLLHKVWGKYIG